jgi:6-phosphofructokinase 1
MAAVEGLVNGKKGMMVGFVDNQIQYTNFKLAITKSKPFNPDMLRMVKILSI